MTWLDFEGQGQAGRDKDVDTGALKYIFDLCRGMTYIQYC